MITQKDVTAFATYILRSKDLDHLWEQYELAPTPKLKQQCLQILEELAMIYADVESAHHEIEDLFPHFENIAFRNTHRLNELVKE